MKMVHISTWPATAIAALSLATAATAQTGIPVDEATPNEPRGYCATRPGLGTTPCTIAPGRVSVEIALADWEHDRTDGQRFDSVVYGDLFVRAGVTDTVEVFAGWTPYGTLRIDGGGFPTEHSSGSGDVTLGGKVNLANPDGSGLSVATSAFVALPTGGRTFGAGDWGAGVLLPISYALADNVSLQLTPEFDIATDGDGHGRHPAASVVAGVGFGVADGVSLTGELSVGRDYDPEETATQAFASVSAAYMPRPDLQLDAGTVFGLTSNSPDARLYAGIAILL